MVQRHSNFKPVKNELFCTPAWVTQSLLSHEGFKPKVWEPANGLGHVSKVLEANNYQVLRTDISYGEDFFDFGQTPLDIITNPPHSHPLAVEFVRHALSITKEHRCKVALLLPFAWDTAPRRVDLFRNNEIFKAKYALTKRIRWENIMQKPAGPSANFAWFVWDWDRPPGDHAYVRYLP